MQPFSQNIIFLDAEFTDLDPDKSELMSLALIKPTGEELYLELEHSLEPSDWVKQNVVPYLKGGKISREAAAERIRQFVGESRPYIVSYVNTLDMIHFYRLFGIENQPCHPMPVDFASILWGNGIRKEHITDLLEIDISNFSKHNALDDARLLKETYYAFYRDQI